MNSGKQVKSAVAGYFRDPRGYTERLGAGPANAGESLRLQTRDAASVRRQIEQALRQVPDFERIRDHIKFSVTGEGLRIDLQETEQGLFFVTGSPNPTGAGQSLLRVLGGELGTMDEPYYFGEYFDLPPITENIGKVTRVLKVKMTPLEVGLKETYKWYLRNHKSRTAGFEFDDKVLAMAKAGSPASV